jgi:hypothetical protein
MVATHPRSELNLRAHIERVLRTLKLNPLGLSTHPVGLMR